MIPLAKPEFTDTAIDQVVSVLRSGMLVQGERVRCLEDAFAKHVGTQEAVAVTSGTAGLHLALMAPGVGPGDEVLVPAFMFPSAANVTIQLGATPIPVDVLVGDLAMDPGLIEDALTARTAAVVVVHEFGLSADWKRIWEVLEPHGIPIVEDAACAIGAAFESRACGSLGEMGVFSLHPRKTITSGEGGMITLDNAALAARLRQLRNQGMDRVEDHLEFLQPGLNYRMTEMQAVLASDQLGNLQAVLETRRAQAREYSDRLGGLPLRLPTSLAGREHTWQTFHVLLQEDVDRDRLIRAMARRGVQVNLGAQALPELSYYRQRFGWESQEWPVARCAYRQGLALPIGPHLNARALEYVAEMLHECMSAPEVHQSR